MTHNHRIRIFGCLGGWATLFVFSAASWAQDRSQFQPSSVRPQESPPAAEQVDDARGLPPIDFNALRQQRLADPLSTGEPASAPPQPRTFESGSSTFPAESPRASVLEGPRPFDSAQIPPTLQGGEARWASGSFGDSLESEPNAAREPSAGSSTAILLSRFSLGDVAQPLPGQPLTLAEALRETPPPQRRAMVVKYWEVYACWARTVVARDAVERLQREVRPQNAVDQGLIQAAIQRAHGHVLHTEITLMRCQSELQQYLPLSGQSEVLPLPADEPLTRSYETQFDWYESQLAGHREPMRMLDRLLPSQRSLIESRAEAVALTDEAWRQATQAYAAGQANLSAALYAGDAWQSAIGEFVEAVIAYNQSIAHYSLTVVTPTLAADRLTAVLIGTPTKTFPVRQASAVDE